MLYSGSDTVYPFGFSRDGKRLLTVSVGVLTGTVWDVAGRREQNHCALPENTINLDATPNLETLAALGRDNTLTILKVAANRQVAAFKASGKREKVAISPDGRMVASVGPDTATKQRVVWLGNAATKRETTLVRGTNALELIEFTPDGTAVATRDLAPQTGLPTVTLWNVATRRGRTLFTGEDARRFVGFAGTSDMVALYGVASSVTRWNLATGRPAISLNVARLADGSQLSADARLLAIYGDDASFRLRDVGTRGTVVGTLPVAEPFTPFLYMGRVPGWLLSPDGKAILTRHWNAARERETLRLRDFATGGNSVIYEGPILSNITFSPEGKTLVGSEATPKAPALLVWDVARKRRLGHLVGHTDYVNNVAFSPKGKILATCGADRTIKLWDLASLREITTLRGHHGMVVALAFSADGKTLASASTDQTVKIWNLVTGQEVASLKITSSPVSLGFSADGTLLTMTDYQDGKYRLRLWRAPALSPPAKRRPAPRQARNAR